MRNGITITNVPPASEPSTLAEWTTFVTAIGGIVGLLVWPILLGWFAWCFRDAISEVLKNLSSFEGPGGLKVQTHKRLSEATQAVEEITASAAVPPQARAAPNARTTEPEATQGQVGEADGRVREALKVSSDEFSKALQSHFEQAMYSIGALGYPGLGDAPLAIDRTFEDLVRVHPASAIIFAWSEVEERLRLLISLSEAPVNSHRGSISRVISTLSSVGLIPGELAGLLREMSDIRNQAAHSRRSSFAAIDAIEFSRSADAANRELKRQISSRMAAD